MKKTLLFSAIACLIFLTNCKKDSEKPDPNNGTYTVEGKLKDRNGIINNAIVTIDSFLNWTATTSNDGYFSIKNVSAGKHSLKVAKINTDSSFNEMNYQISVASDVNLDSILLPVPLKLIYPKDIDYNSILIAWNQTDSKDFYEYKLYRHTTSGLDETTGELIYVSTSKNDTTFKDSSLLSNKQYYYRVFLMNKYGRLGGSNIIRVNTSSMIFSDGDFEKNDFQNYWIRYDKNISHPCYIDSLIKNQGKYSLFANGYYGDDIGLRLKSKPFNLNKNRTYELSFMAKYKGLVRSIQIFGYGVWQGEKSLGGEFIYPQTNNSYFDQSPQDVDWTFYKFEFTTVDDNTLQLDFLFTIDNIWIDDIKIIQK